MVGTNVENRPGNRGPWATNETRSTLMVPGVRNGWIGFIGPSLISITWMFCTNRLRDP